MSTHSPGLRIPGGRRLPVGAVALIAAVGLAACGGSSGAGAGEERLKVVGFSVIKAAYGDLGESFAKTPAGSGVTFASSYGPSGAQSRAVVAGQDADIVAFSLEPDLTAVVEAGKVAPTWNSGATKGIASSSVVVIGVRKGNPKGITSWADLVKPGIGIVTPDPGTSGAAKWNLLGAYTQAADGDTNPAAGEAYVKSFIGNVVTWSESSRVATDTFIKGTGDALISYENEAIAARAAGVELDYIVPDASFLIENPAAVTTTAGPKAAEFLSFVQGAEGQKILAENGFRPVIDGVTATAEGANTPADPFPTIAKLYTIDDLGGWADANTKYFDKENGIITTLRAAGA